MDGPPALLQPTLQGFAEAFIARLVHLVIRPVHDLSIRERAGRLAIGIGLDGVVRAGLSTSASSSHYSL